MSTTEARRRAAGGATDASDSDPSTSTIEVPQAGATIEKPRRKGEWKTLALALAIPLAGGMVSSMIGSPLSRWYANLNKPWWQPPGPVFGAAWSALYAAMGYASWLVYRQGGFQKQKGPLTIYGVQLVVNLLWPIIAFAKKDLKLALGDIVLVLLLSIATWRSFAAVNPTAGKLILPLVLWVSYATALNVNLVQNNP